MKGRNKRKKDKNRLGLDLEMGGCCCISNHKLGILSNCILKSSHLSNTN